MAIFTGFWVLTLIVALTYRYLCGDAWVKAIVAAVFTVLTMPCGVGWAILIWKLLLVN